MPYPVVPWGTTLRCPIAQYEMILNSSEEYVLFCMKTKLYLLLPESQWQQAAKRTHQSREEQRCPIAQYEMILNSSEESTFSFA